MNVQNFRHIQIIILFPAEFWQEKQTERSANFKWQTLSNEISGLRIFKVLGVANFEFDPTNLNIFYPRWRNKWTFWKV